MQTVVPTHAQAAAESPITPESDDWLDIEIMSVAGEEQPSLPLENGYIEVHLPPRFLREGHASFSIHWVDFYR